MGNHYDKDKKLFKIGEVARIFNVSSGTIRHYEKAGFLKPEYIDEESGYRYYSDRQFEVLNTIRYLRVLDMSLEEIADFLKDRDIDVIEEKLENQNLLRFRELSFDGGKTFVPGSLVHKGAPKFRSDNKIIRPINILLDEEEIKEVWKTNDEAIFTFLDHGFMISGAEQKIKTRFVYQGQVFTLYDVKGKQSYLEITGCTNEAVLEEIRSLILKNNA